MTEIKEIKLLVCFTKVIYKQIKYQSRCLSTTQQLIVEMNRLGMLIDLAHVPEKVMNQVLDMSEAPVIFSHSSAYAICPHKRNVPDSVLLRVVSVRSGSRNKLKEVPGHSWGVKKCEYLLSKSSNILI